MTDTEKNMYIYIITTLLSGGRTQNVSLHFEGILKTLLTKTTPGGRSATNFTSKGGVPKNIYLTFWYGPPKKVALNGWIRVVILHYTTIDIKY